MHSWQLSQCCSHNSYKVGQQPSNNSAFRKAELLGGRNQEWRHGTEKEANPSQAYSWHHGHVEKAHAQQKQPVS